MALILLLEDDPVASDRLELLIQHSFQSSVEIEILETESDFVLKWLPDFDQGLRSAPAVIVIDVMLRWTDPGANQPPRPPEVIDGGFMSAGLRCLAHINERAGMSRTKVLLFTALSREDLQAIEPNIGPVDFINKNDGQILVRKIREALSSEG